MGMADRSETNRRKAIFFKGANSKRLVKRETSWKEATRWCLLIATPLCLSLLLTISNAPTNKTATIFQKDADAVSAKSTNVLDIGRKNQLGAPTEQEKNTAELAEAGILAAAKAESNGNAERTKEIMEKTYEVRDAFMREMKEDRRIEDAASGK